MNRLTCLMFAAFALGAGAAHAAAPSPLSCAAVYGVIHDRGPSLRADAAGKAREALILYYATEVQKPVEDVAPDVEQADAKLQAGIKAGTAFPDDDSARCDTRYQFQVAYVSPQPYAKSPSLLSILNDPPPSAQASAPVKPKFSGSGIHSSCKALMDEGIDPQANLSQVQDRARQLGCTQADIDGLGFVYGMLGLQ